MQVHGVTSALLVILETLWFVAGTACPASATATSTCTIRGHVTLRQALVWSACTTLRATHVSTAKWVTMATLLLRAAGVSTNVNVIYKQCHIQKCFLQYFNLLVMNIKYAKLSLNELNYRKK